jgi:hypothetical protein
VVTQPLPLALLALPFAPAAGTIALCGAIATRLAVAMAIRRTARRKAAPLWCIAAGDVLGFAIFCVSLIARKIDWRGASLTMTENGRIRHAPEREIRARPDPPHSNERQMKRTLFLQAPSFDGYDGGAGARYQMKREVKSFWYPTWLAQPAAMVEGSKLIDAPAHDLSWDDIAHEFDDRDLVILHTSTPSFGQDIRTAELIKARNPNIQIAFVGAKVMIEDEKSLKACNAIDLVCREEYDFTCVDLANGLPLAEIDGITWRAADGSIVRNKDRKMVEDMDVFPMVSPIYKRDLNPVKYFGGYQRHPYVSFYTGRGCKSRCTFCLWPQTISGHNYRYRSVPKVIEEVKYILENMPEVKEIFFDDDTLADAHKHVVELSRECASWASAPRASTSPGAATPRPTCLTMCSRK